MLQWVGRLVGGAFKEEPEGVQEGKLSEAAQRLIETTLQPFKDSGTTLVDYHTHLIGTGSSGSGCCVSHDYVDSWNPINRLKGSAYMSAGGVTDINEADEQYVSRMVRLIRSMPVPIKHAILAFDKHYDENGNVVDELVEFYTPNQYVWDLCQQYPDVFLATISVHPYRKDALEELEYWAKKGVRLIKWLPNAMNIDPSHKLCEPFYEKMREYDMVLLSHAGEEKAVRAEKYQRLGNPLLLRSALDHGVKVIIAHCATLGSNPDLDDEEGKWVSNFELFLRLMDEEKYKDLLFADISAITVFLRAPHIPKLLQRQDLHHRLVNGSDYPLPAFNILVLTKPLVKLGLISAEDRPILNEIYNFNPLLYDLMVKLAMRGKDGQMLPREMFGAHPAIGLFLDETKKATSTNSSGSNNENNKEDSDENHNENNNDENNNNENENNNNINENYSENNKSEEGRNSKGKEKAIEE
jgi:predicted TIM-barrel fold metal-dependent hydrolase